MRIIVPYVADKLRLEVTAELTRQAPLEHETRLLVADTDYHDLLVGLWGAAQPFILLEQNVEPKGPLQELWDCPEPWCGYPTPNRSSDILDGDNMCFGCTCFKPAIIAALPGIWTRESPGEPLQKDWWNVASRFRLWAHRAGFEQHRHLPVCAHHRLDGTVS